MTEIRKFRRGKHIYTNWGGQVKEVKTVPEQTEKPVVAPKETVVNIESKDIQNIYSNALGIYHNETEFVLDFFYQHPLHSEGANLKTVLKSRIISSPIHTKRFVKVLSQLIKQYEEKFGQIKE